jgi:hypothetical protein
MIAFRFYILIQLFASAFLHKCHLDHRTHIGVYYYPVCFRKYFLLTSFFQHFLTFFSTFSTCFSRIYLFIVVEIEWIETWLLLDLFSSGIPLGILTALELFYFQTKQFEFTTEVLFEVMKLIALAVDIVGGCYVLFYVIILPLYYGKQHPNKIVTKKMASPIEEGLPKTTEESPLIVDQITNKDDEEVDN